MGFIIAVAGKGGTGKTTTAALLVRLLKEISRSSVLAVDADPNSNFAEALGVKPKETIGSILDRIARSPDAIPQGMSKERFIEYEVQTAVQEAQGFDILTMGRPEGPGCYCYVNNVLRNIMAKLINDYDFIVIDNEAGFEHLSRRTTRSCDALVVVASPSLVALKAAKRISNIVDELEIKTKNKFLIVNCSDTDMDKNSIRDLELEYLGHVPLDPQISKISLNGGSLMKLDQMAESLKILRKIGDKIWR